MTLPVHGDLNNGKEPFLGTATGYMDGTGTLSMVTQDEVSCTGKFEYDDGHVAGHGQFNCADGRHGKFRFTSEGNKGRGFGKTTTGEPFKFTFGRESTLKVL